MDRKAILRTTLGVLGAILIGAIGSGVWEHILRPSLSWTRDSVLNVASLGIEAFKDDIYREIAQGFREAASRRIYSRVILLYVTFYMLILVAYSVFLAETTRKWQGLFDSIAQAKKHVTKEPPSTDDIDREVRALEPKITLLHRLKYVLIVLIALTVAFDIVAFSRNTYVMAAVSHYHQVTRIASPYLSPTEEKMIFSAFSQVTRKADYVAVLSKLEGVASAHGQTVPQFIPW